MDKFIRNILLLVVLVTISIKLIHIVDIGLGILIMFVGFFGLILFWVNTNWNII